MILEGASQRYLMIRERVDQLAQMFGRQKEEVTVVAVSKGHPVESLWEVYKAGCRHFGESRLQEALPKIETLPKDIEWHFIGTLQSNKAKKVISHFQWIHSIDSLDLAKRVALLSEELGKRPAILLEVNTSGEISKHGLTVKQWEAHMDEINYLASLHVVGLMTMAPLTEELKRIRESFRKLNLMQKWMRKQMREGEGFHHLSMGMSQDYEIAIEEGATLLRLGTVIFGTSA